MGITWSFSSDTTCVEETFFGVRSVTCEPTWLFWAVIVAAAFLVVLRAVQLIREFRR